MNELVKKHAPIWLFDSKEKYFPCSYEFFVDSSMLYDKKTSKIIDENPSAESVAKYDSADLFLKPHKRHYHGNPYTAPVYAKCDIQKHDTTDESRWRYRITYTVLYVYNGNIFLISPINIGTHDGDVEHVEFTLDYQTKQLEKIHMARHSTEGVTLKPDECEFRGSHLVVYVSRYSHACYENADRTWRFAGFANDVHDGNGLEWTPPIEMIGKWLTDWKGDFGVTSPLAGRGWLI